MGKGYSSGMPSVTRRRSSGPTSRAQVEAALLAATERLLNQGESYTDLGVQRIAAEAGVARSSFYTHFRDKTELLKRLATVMSETFGVIETWSPTGVNGGPDGLERTFVQTFQIFRQHSMLLAAIHEVSAYDGDVKDFWTALMRPFMQNTIQWLEVERQAGRIPADLDIAAVSHLLVDGGSRFISNYVIEHSADTDPAAARELALTWWYGIFRRPTS